jgi:hypothetical protein
MLLFNRVSLKNTMSDSDLVTVISLLCVLRPGLATFSEHTFWLDIISFGIFFLISSLLLTASFRSASLGILTWKQIGSIDSYCNWTIIHNKILQGMNDGVAMYSIQATNNSYFTRASASLGTSTGTDECKAGRYRDHNYIIIDRC